MARTHSLSAQPVEDLGELRFGEWEGSSIADLDQLPEWRRFNTYRSAVRPPGGEFMFEVQTRMLRRLDCFRRQHPGEIVAIVSHCDPLRAVVAAWLGMPLDHLLRFDLDPASVSVAEAGDWGVRIRCLNETGDVPL
jgi:probable phosphoglycerate mutase